jgi:twinkle protein
MLNELLKLDINLRPGSKGKIKTTCPKCSHTRKHRNERCLSVNVDIGAYTCWNCGWTGVVKTMKEYKPVPQSELVKLSDPVVSWFSTRGISNQTLLRYRVSEGVEYMPQVSEERRCIYFNYFIGDEMVNIKYRDRDKNFKLVSGAQLSLYGLDVAMENSDDNIVIVEGEMDVLSFYEAGVKIAVSVPNGASKGDQKLEWLEDMLPYLSGRKVHLATDNDAPGLSLRNELARRLGKENCLIVSFPEGCKDANDVLLKHGKQSLRQCYIDSEPFPIEGIESVDYDMLSSIWDEGYPTGWKTGWEGMDSHAQWMPGRVTLITGIPGNGKSTFLKNLLVRLSENYGLTYMVYSAEEASATMAVSDILSIKTGKSFFSSPLAPRMSKEEMMSTAPWVNYHFKYYSLSENESSVESILSKAKEMIRRVGINGLVIDNMSTIERQFGSSQDNRHNSIGNMMRDLRQFARENGIHIWLVAHPKKMHKKADGTYEVPNGYDVGDSSHYFNSPDNGVTVHRNRITGQTEVHWWKIRFKYDGTDGVDYFTFNVGNSRFIEAKKVNDGSDTKKFVGQEYASLAGTI